HRPLDHGFDYSFGFMDGCIDNYSHFFYWDGANRHDLWENNKRARYPGRYFPDLMVEKAESFIQAHEASPFFMYFAVNMPHYPYQGDAKWLQYYKEKHTPYPRNLYAAFVDTLDERLQRLLKFLDDTHLRERTIIVYQSDNGHSTEVRAHGGGGNSGPYRGAKFSLFEGGIRLPAVISWPGHLPQGEVRGQVAHSCDWLPTLAELCGVPLPKADLNGRSLVPVLRSATAPTPHGAVLWKVGSQWAVREGDWKLLHDPIDPANPAKPKLFKQHWFLANVTADPGERSNVAAVHPDIVAHLRQLAENANLR
ncbi:MAG: sulfatase-like hydrolase/transferase, partial [Limisphaerales bacterium]